MKKIISILCVCAILLCSLASCNGSKPALQETPASDFTYSENDEGGITVDKYNGNAEEIVIPKVIEGKKVTMLGEQSFAGTGITSVVISDTVKYIGTRAFADCEKLSRLEPGKSLINIARGAFIGCSALTAVDLSVPTLKYIDSSAFANCENLQSVKFGDNIELIRDSAFHGCTALKEVALPKKLKKLGEGAFAECTALEKVTIPADLNLMFTSELTPFSGTSLKEVEFDDGREELIGYACIQTPVGSHVKIIVPSSVKKIETASFLLNGTAELVFLGDCPEIVGDYTDYSEFPYIEPNSGGLTVCYDPDTEGWDTCPWRDMYELKPIG